MNFSHNRRGSLLEKKLSFLSSNFLFLQIFLSFIKFSSSSTHVWMFMKFFSKIFHSYFISNSNIFLQAPITSFQILIKATLSFIRKISIQFFFLLIQTLASNFFKKRSQFLFFFPFFFSSSPLLFVILLLIFLCFRLLLPIL